MSAKPLGRAPELASPRREDDDDPKPQTPNMLYPSAYGARSLGEPVMTRLVVPVLSLSPQSLDTPGAAEVIHNLVRPEHARIDRHVRETAP